MNEMLMRTVDAVAAGAGCALVGAALALELVVRRPVNLPMLAVPAAAMLAGGWIGVWRGEPFNRPAALLLCIGIAAACCAAWVIISRIVDRPMRSEPPLAATLASVGALLAVLSVLAIIPTDQLRAPGDLVAAWTGDPEMPGGEAHLVDSLDKVTFVVTAFILVIVMLMMTRTKVGLAMRAVGYRPQTAALLGINTERLIVIATAMATAMAAIGGLLYGVRQGSVDMTTLLRPAVIAATAVTVAGASRPVAAVLLAWALGSVHAFVQVNWLTGAAAGDAMLMAVVVMALLVKRAERHSGDGVATA